MHRTGDLVPSTEGGWMEYPPPRCHGARLVGWQPCRCGRGHRTWTCQDCDATVYAPELVAGCRAVTADGR